MSRLQNILTLTLLIALAVTGCTKRGGMGGGASSEETAVFAVVNGKEIKGKDVLEKVKGDLADLDRQMYDLKRRATEQVVQDQILEEEAKKQGVTVDKLFAQFDALRDKEVSKDDIANFLKSRGIDEKKLKKEEKESVPNIVRMQRVYEARSKYVNELRQKANVQIKLQRPSEKPVNVATGMGTGFGPAGAKVTIIEFSDFQCPFCERGMRRLGEIKEKYKDKVRIFYRHFPLESIHPQAFKAAEASLCAQEQNKFWDYHDILFKNQANLQEKDFLAYAKELKLDEKAFGECLKSGKHATTIRKDLEEGQSYGVNSTPTFFVNGYMLRGAVPLEQFSELIDDQLTK